MRRLAVLGAVVGVLFAGAASAQPSINGVFPSAGTAPGSFNIGFTSTNLDASSTLLLNGQPQTTLDVTFDDPDSPTIDMLLALVPFSAISDPGLAQLVLTSAAGQSAPEPFLIPTLEPSSILATPDAVDLTIHMTVNFFCDDETQVDTCDGTAQLEKISPDSPVPLFDFTFIDAFNATLRLPAGSVATPGVYVITFKSNKDFSTTAAGAAILPVGTPLELLVARFYSNVLDRVPDPAGAASWTNFLLGNCNPGGFDTLARNFFGSPEFVQTKALTLDQLVAKFYVALLNRAPEPEGQAAWVGVLRQARLTIGLLGFIPSKEFQGLLPDRTDASAVGDVVERFYTQILGRPSEPAGKASWVNYIVSTGDLEGAAQSFLASPEFEARALTFPDFVTILYLTFLGRGPDAAGLNGWVGAMTEAMLLVINTGFVPSAEFQGLSAALCP